MIGGQGRMVMPQFDPSVLISDTAGLRAKGFELGVRMATAKKDREDELKMKAAQIKALEAVANKGTAEADKAAATLQMEINALIAKGKAITAEEKLKLDALIQNRDANLRKIGADARAGATLAEGAEAQAPYVAEAGVTNAQTGVLAAKQVLERQPGVGTELANIQRIRTQASEQMTPEKPYAGELPLGSNSVLDSGR